jgi:hypothetical protein
VIEGFVLPDWAGSSGSLIDAARGRSFDGLQNFGEREGPAFSVTHRCEPQVHVIWHDHNRVQPNCFAIVVKTVLKG